MASKKFVCPKCDKKNFSFDLVSLVGQCFSCGFSGSGKRMLGKLKAEQQKYRPKQVIVDPDREPLRAVYGEGLHFLEARGVSGALAKEIGIKFDGWQIYIPIWSPFTDSPSYVRRNINEKAYYSDGLPDVEYLFGNQNIKDRTTCVLCEGTFDIMSPGLWGRGFSLLGAGMGKGVEGWLRQQRFGRIYLWMDPDETGFRKSPEIAERLRKFTDVVRVHGWAMDPRDPGDYPPTEAKAMIWQALQQGKIMPERV